MNRRAFLIQAMGLSAAQLSCAAVEDLFKGVAKVAQGSQYLATLIDVADAGARAYFNRHPSIEMEPAVEDRIRQARLALSALDAALAAANRADEGDVLGARDKALEAYDAVYQLLDQLGIPKAVPPAGGSETDAPAPKPFELPPVDKVKALLES